MFLDFVHIWLKKIHKDVSRETFLQPRTMDNVKNISHVYQSTSSTVVVLLQYATFSIRNN